MRSQAWFFYPTLDLTCTSANNCNTTLLQASRITHPANGAYSAVLLALLYSWLGVLRPTKCRWSEQKIRNSFCWLFRRVAMTWNPHIIRIKTNSCTLFQDSVWRILPFFCSKGFFRIVAAIASCIRISLPSMADNATTWFFFVRALGLTSSKKQPIYFILSKLPPIQFFYLIW